MHDIKKFLVMTLVLVLLLSLSACMLIGQKELDNSSGLGLYAPDDSDTPSESQPVLSDTDGVVSPDPQQSDELIQDPQTPLADAPQVIENIIPILLDDTNGRERDQTSVIMAVIGFSVIGCAGFVVIMFGRKPYQ